MAQDHALVVGSTVGIHAHVTIPDGRTGTVAGTRSRTIRGQENPLGYRVRLDGAERDGPHPWFLTGMLTVQAPATVDPASLSNPIASGPGATPV